MLANVAEEVNIETQLTEDWLWSGAHHSCTTPLGDTPSDLVDKNLKLKFCDNVYVCDGSVDSGALVRQYRTHDWTTGIAVGAAHHDSTVNHGREHVPLAYHRNRQLPPIWSHHVNPDVIATGLRAR